VTALAGMVAPRLTEDATRARPLRLNRYGLALRIEYAHGHRDVHLPFPTPVDTGRGLTVAMRGLVEDATHGISGRGSQHRGPRR
jgi:hypothetical protein